MEKAKQFQKDVLLKSPTGILGSDEITNSGLPSGRPTLICGEITMKGDFRTDESLLQNMSKNEKKNGEELL